MSGLCDLPESYVKQRGSVVVVSPYDRRVVAMPSLTLLCRMVCVIGVAISHFSMCDVVESGSEYTYPQLHLFPVMCRKLGNVPIRIANAVVNCAGVR